MRRAYGSIGEAGLLAVVLLSGAVAHAQPKGNPAMPCFRALADDPRFASVKDKVSLSGTTMDEMRRMTTSGERASAQEAPVLAAWKDARADCHRLETDYFASRDARIQEFALAHFAALQNLIVDLQSGKITYGDFGRRRIELYEKLQLNVEAVRREILPPKLPPPPGSTNK